MSAERDLHDDAAAHLPAIRSTGRADVQAYSATRSGCLAPRWYAIIDDERTYAEGHMLLLLPAYLSTNLVWVADPNVGFPTIQTSRRVVRSATMAFTVAA